MTLRLFLEDATLRTADATIVAVLPEGIVLDRTVFYARSGGQPGDTGALSWDGGRITIGEALKGTGEDILHPVLEGAAPPPGTKVNATLDWPRRHALMRMHTTLHLLCSLLPGAAVTGGQIGAERSRLDFDLPEPPSREALQEGLARLVAAGLPVSTEWVDEAILDARPELVRTLSVKPPRGAGRVRLVRIGAPERVTDLQPCGGTHVTSTGEIGSVNVVKIENKGRQNRRIVVTLAPAE